MAQQLIFTSTPQGLEPGRSGYCTVARHKDIRQRLVRELERISVYDFGQQVGGNRVDISVYRKITLGSEEFYVLTRICDAGMDYTNRTNYLAHHLILDGFEIATSPSPAEIFLNWSGWKKKWEEGPRYLNPSEEVVLTGFKSKGLVPCKNWLSFTNDPGNGAALVSPSMVKPIVVENNPGQSTHLLQLFAESSALLKLSLDAWDYSFTTYLQGNDDPKSFAWIGIEGQPAAERLKQGGVRNYIDLREWSATNLSDQLDASLSHIARKGPTAPPSKRVKKSPSSNTRSPLSSQQVNKIKATSSAYLTSAPSGSSVKSQETDAKKNKKKRPWLLQLAVISTALCLLGALIFGLVYNLGDWFNDSDGSPDDSGKVVRSEPVKDKEERPTHRPISIGSFAKLGQTEYLRVTEKPTHLRWLKVDVGTREPIKVRIDDSKFEKFEVALEKINEGDDLKVVVQKSEDGLFFENLDTAPLITERGELKEVSFEGQNVDNLKFTDDKFSISYSGEDFNFDIRKVKPSERRRIIKLFELLDSGKRIPFSFRSEGTNIIHIDSFKLPNEEGEVTNLNNSNEPLGVDMLISITGGKDSLYYEEGQMRIGIPIDKNEIDRKYYLFKEDEKPRIESLRDFSKSGDGKIDLKIKLKDDQITYLEFVIPTKIESSTMPAELSAADLVVSKRVIFWIPGTYKNSDWQIDTSRKSFRYEYPRVSSFLYAFFKNLYQQSKDPVVWMADYKPGYLFNSDSHWEGNAVEEFSYEFEEALNVMDLVNVANISFKSEELYSFDFEITENKEIDITYNADHAFNSLINGKVIRAPIPNSNKECIEIFLVSNKHGDYQKPSKLGLSYFLQNNKLSLSSESLNSESFTFLYSGEPVLFSLSANDLNAHNLRVLSREYTWKDLINPDSLGGLPSILKINEEMPFEATITLELDYFQDATNKLNKTKSLYEGGLPKDLQNLPEANIYNSFLKYAKDHSNLFSYDVGAPYHNLLFNVPLSFVQQRLKWDEIKHKNFKSKLELAFNNRQLAYDPDLLVAFWSAVSEEVKKYFLEEYKKNIFEYKKDLLEEHMKLIFDTLDLILKVQRLYGIDDREIFTKFNDVLNVLASTDFDDKESPIFIFNKEVSLMEKLHPEVRQDFAKHRENYEKSKSENTPLANLKLDSIKVALDTISDRGKNTLYLEGKDRITGYKNAISTIGNKINEIFDTQNRIINDSESDPTDRKLNIISNIPWTIGIYKKDKTGQWSKESDFLRLAPPLKL